MESEFCPLPGTEWQRSSYCVGDNHCVEISSDPTSVYMRNSRMPDHHLRFDRRDWPGLIDWFASAEAAP
jgi:hypothetical protein